MSSVNYKKVFASIAGVVLVLGGYLAYQNFVVATADIPALRYSETEPGFDEVGDVGEFTAEHQHALDRHMTEGEVINATSLPPIPEPIINGRTAWAAYWQPFNEIEAQVYGTSIGPFDPPRVGIQIGHWQREDAPDELAGLRANSGANVAGVSEAAVMYEIGVLVQSYLEAEGVVVDLLPVTIPVDYQASAFLSLHGDGSSDTSISGFKTATPRTDFSGRAAALKAAVDGAYAAATGLREDTAVTRRMTGYYAFNWRRYDHAVHPQTPAVIIETGFLTNPSDRQFLVNTPERAARGIADGVLQFLAAE